MYVSKEAKTLLLLCVVAVIGLVLFNSLRDHTVDTPHDYKNPKCVYFAQGAAQGDAQSQQDYNTWCTN